MPTLLDYAVLSAVAYDDVRKGKNQVTVPTDWTHIGIVPSSLGFAAVAYKNGSDIVISYEGTDTDTTANSVADWLGANIPASVGIGSTQIVQAALFYEQIKADNPNANITFTGHSLGGGLASLMAVFFNRPATTFDEAPFLLAALNPIFISALEATLLANGFADSSFSAFLAATATVAILPPLTPVALAALVTLRQSNVNTYDVSGEVLSYIRNSISAVYGSDTLIPVGSSLLTSDPSIPAVTLHSIILLSALEISKTFQTDTVKLPNLLPAIFSSSLYFANPFQALQQDFLTKLLNDQISVGYTNANGLLRQFSSDVANISGGLATSNDMLNKALIAAVIEDYYFMANGFTKAFFNKIGDGISFNLNDINPADNTADTAMTSALINILGQSSASLAPVLNYQWYVDGASGAISASASDTLPALMLASNGNAILSGGIGNDVLVAGVGNDTLSGGAGIDSYIFNTGDGQDTIIDSDGKGIIYENGTKITGTQVKSTHDGNNTLWSDGGTEYKFTPNDTVSATGIGTLMITMGSDTITIKGFDLSKAQNGGANGHLGINFKKQLTIAAGTSGLAPANQGDQTADVPTGNSKTFTIYASSASATAQTVQLALSGGGSYDLLTGNTLTSFNGTTSVTIAAGKDSATFTLIDLSTTNQADTATLTASLTDTNGKVTSNNLVITFDDPASASPTPLNSYVGQGEFIPANTAKAFGVYGNWEGMSFDYTLYTNGSRDGIINTGTGINIFATTDNFNDNQVINGGGGQDLILLKNQNSLINGNGGQEVINTGDGNNAIYVNHQTDLASALAARSDTTSGKLGSFISVGNGNNTIVGGVGNDVVLTGAGNNLLVLGSGSNYVGGGLLLSWVGHDIVPSFPLFKSYTDNGVTFGISTPFTAPANYQGSYSNSESSSGNNLTVTSGVPVGIGNGASCPTGPSTTRR